MRSTIRIAFAVVLERREHEDEFVPAHARHRVVRTHVAAQPVGDGAQHAIAGVVAEVVVDTLEPVEVNVADGERRLEPRTQQHGLPYAVGEQQAVGERGERIVECQRLGALLMLLHRIGVAFHVQDASDVDALVMLADRAMYEAKRAGCNCARYGGAQAGEDARKVSQPS